MAEGHYYLPSVILSIFQTCTAFMFFNIIILYRFIRTQLGSRVTHFL